MDPKWLDWVARLRAVAQNGLAYSSDHFDLERYAAVRAVAAEIAADHSGADTAFIGGLFARETGHATPKVDVRGGAFRDDKVLLVKERADGLWTLPGGWADPHESPSEAVVREFHEESGYQARVLKLVAAYDRSRHGHPSYPFAVYMLFFLCEITGGSPTRSAETSEVGFFDAHELPELSLHRVTAAQVSRVYEHHYHPDLATDFD